MIDRTRPEPAMPAQTHHCSLCSLFSRLLTVFLLMALFGQSSALAQDDENKAKPAKLFESDSVLEVTLSAPWRDIVRHEDVPGPYPATIEFTDDSGERVSLPLTVERRGLTRQRVCEFPPIKLRFEKGVAKGTVFRGQKSIKMVTHCDKGSRYQQYYVKEMLAYRIYNLITDFSFRVRPLSISYQDSERGSKQDPRFAFLIEDDSDVAKRNGLKKLDIPEISVAQLETQEASNFALFQYLISNLDWSALSGPGSKDCCHNAKLIGPDPETGETRPMYAIPYDFDSSGIVDAPYAAPPDKIPVNTVTQRVYRGFCAHNGSLEDAKQRFLDKESEIYALFKNEPQLKSRNANWAVKFMERFYETVNDPKDWQRKIIEKCRK
jgi:hypothetical protein